MSGWLLCDGSEISRAGYPRLFQLLGDAYGDAAEDKFRLPDYRGAFLRGVNGSRDPSRDPDAASRSGSGPGDSGNSGNAVGSLQEQQFQEHEHEIQTAPVPITPGDNPPPVQVVRDVISPTTRIDCRPGTVDSSECFGKETRPVNLYVNFLIKALPDRVTLTVPAGLQVTGGLR